MPLAQLKTLTWLDVSWVALLLLISGVVSVLLQLKLEKRLFWASFRTLLQLTILGFVLEYVFQASQAWLVLLILALMIVLAALHSTGRAALSFKGSRLLSLLSLSLSTTLTIAIVLGLIVQVRPWHTPQYIIPLVGMILGNSLTGVSLGVDRFLESLKTERTLIESRLYLGATSWEAALPSIRKGIHAGHIPILNAMTIAGLVSLPGMMTGQILSGISPLLAVRYQIVVMFMIAAACSLGTTLFVILSAKKLFTPWHQLDAEKIQTSD